MQTDTSQAAIPDVPWSIDPEVAAALAAARRDQATPAQVDVLVVAMQKLRDGLGTQRMLAASLRSAIHDRDSTIAYLQREVAARDVEIQRLNILLQRGAGAAGRPTQPLSIGVAQHFSVEAMLESCGPVSREELRAIGERYRRRTFFGGHQEVKLHNDIGLLLLEVGDLNACIHHVGDQRDQLKRPLRKLQRKLKQERAEAYQPDRGEPYKADLRSGG